MLQSVLFLRHTFIAFITAGSKVRSFGQWVVATCAAPLVSLPVSTPLQL